MRSTERRPYSVKAVTSVRLKPLLVFQLKCDIESIVGGLGAVGWLIVVIYEYEQEVQ